MGASKELCTRVSSRSRISSSFPSSKTCTGSSGPTGTQGIMPSRWLVGMVASGCGMFDSKGMVWVHRWGTSWSSIASPCARRCQRLLHLGDQRPDRRHGNLVAIVGLRVSCSCALAGRVCTGTTPRAPIDAQAFAEARKGLRQSINQCVVGVAWLQRWRGSCGFLALGLVSDCRPFGRRLVSLFPLQYLHSVICGLLKCFTAILSGSKLVTSLPRFARR